MEKLFNNKEWLIEQYKQGKEIRQIAKEIKCSTASIVYANKKFGISATDYNPRYKYKNKEWLQKQFDLYGNVSNVAKQSGYPRTSITRYAERYGIREKKYERPVRYNVNSNFFKKINSEEKSYWLGMLMADGWITLNKENRYRLGMKLQHRDKEHLIKFAKSISYNGPIQEKTNQQRIYNVIEINDQEFCINAINVGIVERKSGKETFPIDKIEKPFLKDFIRGFCDGDGSISGYLCKNKSAWINFCGMSKEIMVSIKFFLETQNIHSKLIETKTTPFSKFDKDKQLIPKDFYFLNITRKKDIYRFLKLIYKDSNIYLNRKYDKAIQLIKEYENEYL